MHILIINNGTDYIEQLKALISMPHTVVSFDIYATQFHPEMCAAGSCGQQMIGRFLQMIND